MLIFVLIVEGGVCIYCAGRQVTGGRASATEVKDTEAGVSFSSSSPYSAAAAG